MKKKIIVHYDTCDLSSTFLHGAKFLHVPHYARALITPCRVLLR